MKQHRAKLALLAILSLAGARTIAQGPQSQSAPAQEQSQQPTQPPPHVDAEPDPGSRALESSITDALKQDPHMAYARVSVSATDTEIVLTGVVLTATAKDQAAQIATEHAGGRKVTNKIRVNPNTHPGPGL